MNATAIRDRLDEIERALPALPARVLRHQRRAAVRLERQASARFARIVGPVRRTRRPEVRASVDESLTRAELYRRAQERDIAGRSSMSKAELVAALNHT